MRRTNILVSTNCMQMSYPCLSFRWHRRHWQILQEGPIYKHLQWNEAWTSRHLDSVQNDHCEYNDCTEHVFSSNTPETILISVLVLRIFCKSRLQAIRTDFSMLVTLRSYSIYYYCFWFWLWFISDFYIKFCLIKSIKITVFVWHPWSTAVRI